METKLQEEGRTKIEQVAHKMSLPKGNITPFYVKCGRKNCRCAKDVQYRHGPYWYSRSQRAGRRKKSYIRLEQVNTVDDALSRSQNSQVEANIALESSVTALSVMRDLIRQIESGGIGN
jgi:hypothetical protein